MELKPTMHMIGCDWLLGVTQNVWLTDWVTNGSKYLRCFRNEKDLLQYPPSSYFISLLSHKWPLRPHNYDYKIWVFVLCFFSFIITFCFIFYFFIVFFLIHRILRFSKFGLSCEIYQTATLILTVWWLEGETDVECERYSYLPECFVPPPPPPPPPCQQSCLDAAANDQCPRKVSSEHILLTSHSDGSESEVLHV